MKIDAIQTRRRLLDEQSAEHPPFQVEVVPETPAPGKINFPLTNLPESPTNATTDTKGSHENKKCGCIHRCGSSFSALNVQAYFDPTIGRWANRDPVGDLGFIESHADN